MFSSAQEMLMIPVEPEIVRNYQEASEQTKGAIRMIVRSLLNAPTFGDRASAVADLQRTMDEIGNYAEAQGLTPEILEELLDE